MEIATCCDRDTTERPVTVTVGTNVIIGRDMNLLCREVKAVLNGERKDAASRLFGMAGPLKRIAQIFEETG